MKNCSLSQKIRETNIFLEIILVLCISYLWETIEHYLETIGPFVSWFAGVEFWANRIIFDGLCVFFGYLFIKKYPTYINFARFFSLTWLVFHVFIFPHSMYLHEIISFEIPYIWGNKTTSCFDFWSIEHFFTGMSIGFLVIQILHSDKSSKLRGLKKGADIK